jgi:hypothetical protein
MRHPLASPPPDAIAAIPLPSPSARPSGITVWRPEIVVPPALLPAEQRAVVIAEPALRPEAVRAQVAATRSALAHLAETRAVLDVQAAALDEQARGAGTERERVAAVVEAYRIQSALDEALRAAARRAGVVKEARGRR